MTTYLTSDEHYGHKNIIVHCSRLFADVDDMGRQLVERHNAVVRPDDEVWHLGDFAWKEPLVAPILSQLNGTHYLVVGNHDVCHPMHKKSAAAVTRYVEAGFKLVLVEHELAGFRLHHMPFSNDDRHDDKYDKWRPVRSDKWLLHGHVHQSWKQMDKQINVGVDVWDYAPVSLEALCALRDEA